MNTEEIRLGLCEGRHEIPEVSGYIFPKDFFESENLFDFDRINDRIHEVLKDESNVTLYVTGFTPALVEVINYCTFNLMQLKLMHFNRETNSYITQKTRTNYWLSNLKEGGYVNRDW